MELTACIISALVVILIVYAILKSMCKANQKQIKLLEETLLQRLNNPRKNTPDKTLVSHRLQAYERMTLFLERINPPNLIPRITTSGKDILLFQSLLLKSIREEYEHNLSQQLYVSDLAWESCKTAKETIVQIIIQSASSLGDSGDASQLAEKILTSGFQKENNPVENALKLLKKEIREQF